MHKTKEKAEVTMFEVELADKAMWKTRKHDCCLHFLIRILINYFSASLFGYVISEILNSCFAELKGEHHFKHFKCFWTFLSNRKTFKHFLLPLSSLKYHCNHHYSTISIFTWKFQESLASKHLCSHLLLCCAAEIGRLHNYATWKSVLMRPS